MSDVPPKVRIVEVSGVAHRPSHFGLGQHRPECGAMKFGDDWPGLFLRGDAAEVYHAALNRALLAMEEGDPPHMHIISILRDLKTELGLPTDKEAPVQELKEFSACKP